MQNKRVQIAILVGIAALIVAGIIFAVTRKGTDQIVTPQNEVGIFATPTLSQATPSAAAAQLPGGVWKFVSMEENAIYQNGFWYDVGTFQNVDRPDITIRAMCMAPQWPSPTPGQLYMVNDYQVMYPVPDNATNNLQRFQVLK